MLYPVLFRHLKRAYLQNVWLSPQSEKDSRAAEPRASRGPVGGAVLRRSPDDAFAERSSAVWRQIKQSQVMLVLTCGPNSLSPTICFIKREREKRYKSEQHDFLPVLMPVP